MRINSPCCDDDRRWEARNDLRTLTEAAEIDQDSSRKRAVIREGERQIREAKDRLKEAESRAKRVGNNDDMFKGYTSLGKMNLDD